MGWRNLPPLRLLTTQIKKCHPLIAHRDCICCAFDPTGIIIITLLFVHHQQITLKLIMSNYLARALIFLSAREVQTDDPHCSLSFILLCFARSPNNTGGGGGGVEMMMLGNELPQSAPFINSNRRLKNDWWIDGAKCAPFWGWLNGTRCWLPTRASQW